jgi:hypothetical protein
MKFRNILHSIFLSKNFFIINKLVTQFLYRRNLTLFDVNFSPGCIIRLQLWAIWRTFNKDYIFFLTMPKHLLSLKQTTTMEIFYSSSGDR